MKTTKNKPSSKKDSVIEQIIEGVIIILFLGVVCFGFLVISMFIMNK